MDAKTQVSKAVIIRHTHEPESSKKCRELEQKAWRRERAFLEIKADYRIGDKITKDKWPGYYKQTWGIHNLYVVALGPHWRLTYTLVWEGAGITALCLEILSHKHYDRRFGYRTT